LTIQQFVYHGAVKMPGENAIYTCMKETQVVAVDSKTGMILTRYSPGAAKFIKGRYRALIDAFNDRFKRVCESNTSTGIKGLVRSIAICILMEYR
jgi:hypothetical protein